MARGTLVVAAAIAGAVAGSIVVACSDPYGGAEQPGAEAGADVVAADASTTDAVVDAGPFDDVITIDAQKIDAADCRTCDCDGDGFDRENCVATAADAGAVDCDDDDPNRRPNQTFVASVPPPTQVPRGDWNCSNVAEKLYAANVTCSSFTSGCAMHSGFNGDPPCGVEGDFVQCTQALAGLNCMNGAKTKRTQACK